MCVRSIIMYFYARRHIQEQKVPEFMTGNRHKKQKKIDRYFSAYNTLNFLNFFSFVIEFIPLSAVAKDQVLCTVT